MKYFHTRRKSTPKSIAANTQHLRRGLAFEGLIHISIIISINIFYLFQVQKF